MVIVGCRFTTQATCREHLQIAHADDISVLILAWAFALARNEPFDRQSIARSATTMGRLMGKLP
jgi:hypothetical protein